MRTCSDSFVVLRQISETSGLNTFESSSSESAPSFVQQSLRAAIRSRLGAPYIWHRTVNSFATLTRKRLLSYLIDRRGVRLD